MTELVSTTLSRDCPAVEIPAGRAVTLPAGTHVDITQTLGGNYTVRTLHGLFRIAATDIDVLVLEDCLVHKRDIAATQETQRERYLAQFQLD